MKILFATLALLVGKATFAQSWIDYELVLKQHADKVVTSTDPSGDLRRELHMGTGVRVSCTGPVGNASCLGIDFTKFGAIGCGFAIINELRHVALECPGFATDSELSVLDQRSRLMAQFILDNSVPPLGPEDMDRLLAGKSWDGPLNCAADAARDSDIYNMMRAIVDQDLPPDPAEHLGPSRLPVMNPCL